MRSVLERCVRPDPRLDLGKPDEESLDAACSLETAPKFNMEPRKIKLWNMTSVLDIAMFGVSIRSYVLI